MIFFFQQRQQFWSKRRQKGSIRSTISLYQKSMPMRLAWRRFTIQNLQITKIIDYSINAKNSSLFPFSSSDIGIMKFFLSHYNFNCIEVCRNSRKINFGFTEPIWRYILKTIQLNAAVVVMLLGASITVNHGKRQNAPYYNFYLYLFLFYYLFFYCIDFNFFL